LILISENEENRKDLWRSFRNIDRLSVNHLSNLNANHLLSNNYIVLNKISLMELGKRIGFLPNFSQTN
jgi:hypothetical protein